MLYKLNGFVQGRDQGFYSGSTTITCPTWPCGMWFGANDIDEEGYWRWSNGQLLSDYGFGAVTNGLPQGVFPWGSVNDVRRDFSQGSNEPNNYRGPGPGGTSIDGENCGRLDLQYSTGKWNDVSCDWVNPFVCEFPIDNSTTHGRFYAPDPSPSPPPSLKCVRQLQNCRSGGIVGGSESPS